MVGENVFPYKLLIHHYNMVFTFPGTTTGEPKSPDIKFDMEDTEPEPATATHPMNWRIIKDHFPDTTGVMTVSFCWCKETRL